MKIIGWDIGIKNLSYCIINVDDIIKTKLDAKAKKDKKLNPSKYKKCKIIDWGIIDLSLEEKDESSSINAFIKNVSTNTKSVSNLTSGDNATPSPPTKPKKPKKATSIKLYDLCKKIETVCSQNANFKDIDYVVIENQPVLKNPTMKSIQIMVYSYFVFENRTRNEVSFVNASNKLKVCKEDVPADILLNINKLKSKYSRNKKLSIIHTRIMINILDEDEKWKQKFEASKKKDDLADSYLMTLYYIYNRID